MGRLILWDIDGTLVHGDGVGAEVFDRAFDRALGILPPSRPPMSGKTDPQIVREYLALLDLAATGDTHLPAVLAHLETELAAASGALRARGRAQPGVEALLDRLASDDRFHQTALTGNIAPNARVKLAAFGLDRFLDLAIGAYGSDDPDRSNLVPVALARAADQRGLRFGTGEVWVIGDAPNDLACARAGGVRCLLVGTGGTALDVLAALEPDALREDLTDLDEILELLAS